jgi:hypothetical protein
LRAISAGDRSMAPLGSQANLPCAAAEDRWRSKKEPCPAYIVSAHAFEFRCGGYQALVRSEIRRTLCTCSPSSRTMLQEPQPRENNQPMAIDPQSREMGLRSICIMLAFSPFMIRPSARTKSIAAHWFVAFT